MTAAERYHAGISAIVARIDAEQRAAIERVGAAIADTVARGALIHVFGSGHSHMAAEEVFHRAGGLCCVNAILDPALFGLGPFGMHLERLEGYVPIVLAQYDLRPGEHLIVVSHSGINAAPVEAAIYGKARGLVVTALTSLEHSRDVPSRHSSGRRLFEVADYVIDTCGPRGDALVAIDGVSERVGGTSTVATTIIMNMIIAAVIERLLAAGVRPPVRVSVNVPEGAAGNEERCAALEERIRVQPAYASR
ncbi:MAG TPA: SIS domain-containing protein [bacterium]|nr:SIS domain-containing protein [bacterium]